MKEAALCNKFSLFLHFAHKYGKKISEDNIYMCVHIRFRVSSKTRFVFFSNVFDLPKTEFVANIHSLNIEHVLHSQFLFDN